MESKGSLCERQDIAWRRQQGRTAFRDQVRYTENAATGAALFSTGTP